jgi:DNA invertase Pin-like site-specific DNA recombinase
MAVDGENRFGGAPRPPVRMRAAEYVRMSTEHQQYSTENQAEAIRRYASARSIVVVKTYADQGKSGLNLDGRDALKRLIQDVDTGRADFETILVYDVSRWGRFQDADESAYYEYICKRAGITVHYCAEQFENDGSPVSTIVKGVKRAMAGEYSRELSAKVFAGQCRLIELGFRQGGTPGYGLRRALIDQTGAFKGNLRHGEHKSIQTDRVVLKLGPEDEVAIVRAIYKRFVEDGVSEVEIADELNTKGLTAEFGRKWTRGIVHQILINEKYIGNNIWNRISFKLKKKIVRNHPDMWIRAEGAFPGIVTNNLFHAAQAIINARSFQLSDEDLLNALRGLRETHGLLSGLIIDEADGIPSSSVYRARFGSLLRAYYLVGYSPSRDYRYLQINRELRAMHPLVLSRLRDGLEAVGCRLSGPPGSDVIWINNELTISVVIARCFRTPGGSHRWRVRFDAGQNPSVTIAVRMDALNKSPLDYYIFPLLDISAPKLKLGEENGFALDCYRYESLEPLFEFLQRINILEVA